MQTVRRLVLTACIAGLILPSAVAAQEGMSGPYLAGRAASGVNDYRAAGLYYTRALAHDPSNPALLENALLAQLGAGNIPAALPVAEALRKAGNDQVTSLVLIVDLAKKGDYDRVLTELEAHKAAGPLIEGLFRAWAELGRGRMSEATTAFDAVSAMDGLEAFGQFHKALALASAGDFEGADAILTGAGGAQPLPLTRRGVIARAQILSQLEHNPDAIALIDETFGTEPDPAVIALRARLQAGETLPFTVVTSATDGMAEVMYSVAGALSGEATDIFTLIYAQLATYLRPDHVDAALLVAGLLETQGQHDLATEVYGRVPRDDPAYSMAELGRADALVAAKRNAEAIEVLQSLAKARPDQPVVWSSLGDTLRREERYEEAARAYDAAIKLFTTPEKAQWSVYYARGICNERLKQWPKAEPDFRKALDLSPDQPQVLNYMGYAFLEMKTNLDEAMSMIQRAVAARPDDGYIVDSLGWALYRTGRYGEAVGHMERAVELMPVDPVVNDHLGDVYWAVGRMREAEFQWKRALSFKPDTEEEAARIRRKLEVGLDKVLAEEGAPPLATPANAN